MTVSMLVVDSPFAVVAADQKWTVEVWAEGEEHEVSHGFHRKVEAHPTLGLVWVSSGIGMVHHRDEARTVNDLILEALQTPLDGPLNERVVPRLDAFLGPLVRAELELGGYDDLPETQARLAILLGISDHGMAGGALIQFGRAAEAKIVEHGSILPSADTAAYFNSLPQGTAFPRLGSTPRAITQHMKRLLAAAIADAARIAGDNADVGGDVDIAIAGPQGARLLT